MDDLMNQLRQLRPPSVSAPLTNRVRLKAERILAGQDRFPRPARERAFAILVATVSLTHLIWTVVFMNGLAH